MSLRIDSNTPGVLWKGLEKNRKGMTGTGQALKKKEEEAQKVKENKKKIFWALAWHMVHKLGSYDHYVRTHTHTHTHQANTAFVLQLHVWNFILYTYILYIPSFMNLNFNESILILKD